MKTLLFFPSLTGFVLSVATAVVLWLSFSERTQAQISHGIAYLVDSTGDGDLVGPSTDCNDGTGHCTLRAAIEASNLHSDTDGISFDIPTSDPGYSNGVWTIQPGKALPDLSDGVNIIGPAQPRWL
jgi:CSLREA domain-containing protein